MDDSIICSMGDSSYSLKKYKESGRESRYPLPIASLTVIIYPSIHVSITGVKLNEQ